MKPNLPVTVTAVAAAFLSVAPLARAAGCSPSYIDKLFRAELGMTVRESVLRARLERVKTLLSSTNRSMTEIASECGFARDSHLSRLFRQETGHTMREWRHEHRETPDE